MGRKRTTTEESANPLTQVRKRQLSPREATLVDAVVAGATKTRAALIAGYPEASASQRAYEVTSRPHVQAAIADRRSQAMRDAGIDLGETWRQVKRYAFDDDPDVRPSSTNNLKMILQAAGEIGADVNVNVDARSAVLPGVDPDQVLAAYERLFVDATVIGPADAGTDDVAGG